MVVLAEIVFARWEHEEVNRGLLNMFCKKNISVGLAATKEHIQNLKRIERFDVPIKEYYIKIPSNSRSEKEEASEEYAMLIESIIEHYQLNEKDILVILTGRNAGINGAYSLYCKKRISCAVWFVLHSFDEAMEQYSKNMNSFQLISLLNKIGRCDKFRYITFNPNTVQCLQGLIHEEILTNIVFFHHPVAGNPLRMNASPYKKIVAYGASAQIEFRRLLYKMLKENTLKKGMFEVLCNILLDDLDTNYLYPTKIVTTHYGINGFARDKYIKKIELADWILIPYGKDLYKTQMSGILCDAIRWKKPIVASECPIIDWYHSKHPIGIIANNMEELAKSIVDIFEGQYDEAYLRYSENIEVLKAEMENENQQILEIQLQKL